MLYLHRFISFVYTVTYRYLLYIVIYLLAEFFNRFISQATYPDSLKLARVVPVFKSGDSANINNYRPISILSTVNKVFETLTFDRISSFLNSHNIISNNQYGFRAQRNTTQAIFTLVSDLLNTFNKKIYTIAIFIDLKKAFDSVNLDILLHKLNLYGFRGLSNSFFESYLKNRKQFVYVNGKPSKTNNIDIGVPQGSNLGPQMFNIFINDPCKITPGRNIFFADDGIFYVTDTDFPSCVSSVKLLIENISKWMLNNKLTVNTAKTKLMYLSPRPIDDLPNIHFNGQILEWVDSFKYLGIILDKNLNFILQSREVVKRLSRLNGVFYSIRNYIPRQTLLNIFHSIVHPVLTQNLIIWGGICRSNTSSVKILINKILRSILRVKFNDQHIPLMGTNEMYKTLGILQLDDMYL